MISKTRIEEREYYVVKANKLIQKTNFNLSEQEQKIILYIISKIKKDDQELEDFVFNLVDFYEICGVYNDSGSNYTYLRKTLKNMADKSFWVKSEDESISLVRWFTHIKIIPKSTKVLIRFNEMLKPYLLYLSNDYTQYRLLYPLAMKSQYSIRLYELLLSHEYKKQQRCRFSVEEIKVLISAQNHKQYSDFRKRAIDIAIRDINQFSDLNVSYEPIKEGRKIVALEFLFFKKNVRDRQSIDLKNQKMLEAKNCRLPTTQQS